MVFQYLRKGAPASEIQKAIAEGAVLIDVRTPNEFLSGSVDGAINIPLQNLDSIENRVETSKTIIVFCRSGSRSSQAKSVLEKKGYPNVINGGTWQNINQLIESNTK